MSDTLPIHKTADKIEGKAKVILPKNTTQVNAGIDKSSGEMTNNLNDGSTQKRNGDIIVLKHYSEERVISLTILSILFSLLIIIAISFIYIYICKKYFRNENCLLGARNNYLFS